MSYSTLGFVMTQRAAFELMMCLFAEPMVILGAPAQHHHHHHYGSVISPRIDVRSDLLFVFGIRVVGPHIM